MRGSPDPWGARATLGNSKSEQGIALSLMPDKSKNAKASVRKTAAPKPKGGKTAVDRERRDSKKRF